MLTEMTPVINHRVIIGTKFATNFFRPYGNKPYPLLSFPKAIFLLTGYLTSIALDTSI